MLNSGYFYPSTHKGFNSYINHRKYIIQDLRAAYDFDQYYISNYICTIANPKGLNFSSIGEEITIGEEQFLLITTFQNMYKRTIIVGQKTGDRYFLYAFTTEFVLGITKGIPLFFDMVSGTFFITLVKPAPNEVWCLQGKFHNKWEEQPLLNLAGVKIGNIELESEEVKYKIPIYTYAVPSYSLRDKWFNSVTATQVWYGEGLISPIRWDQGKEIIWMEKEEVPRRAMLPFG